jgi:hypothetical protein
MSDYVTDVDLLNSTSSVSIPFYLVSLPTAERISANFVYNYYTRDEGVSEVVTLDAVDALSDEYNFIVENWENGKYPRQIDLIISNGSSYSSVTLDAGTITTALSENKIIYEDAPFDTRFSSIIVHDTSIDEKIYNTTPDIAESTSLTVSSDFLNIAKQQSNGYRFSNSQTRESIVSSYEKDIKSVNLGISLNDLVAADVLNTTQRWQSSAYADEFAYAAVQLAPIQENARNEASTNPFIIRESDVDISVVSISSTYTATSPYDDPSTRRDEGSAYKTKKVGFIIEKHGEQLDGTTLRYPDIVIEDPDLTTYSDIAVRYGAVYKYRIRTVYKSTIIAASKDPDGDISGFAITGILIASTGVSTTIQCLEVVPPPPPTNISFQQTLNGLYIRWNFPVNPQKDIKRFQVLRRQSIELPFTLIREINFDKTISPYSTGESVPVSILQIEDGPIKHYLDADFFNIRSDFIYAICAIDAHGFSSQISEQFRVRFDQITGKLIISRVSTSGAPKPYPNINIVGDFFNDIIKDSGHSRVRIYFDPEYSDVTRFGTSLSLISTTMTGEATYKLSMTELNIGQSQTVDIVVGNSIVNTNGIPVSIARFYTAD